MGLHNSWSLDVELRPGCPAGSERTPPGAGIFGAPATAPGKGELRMLRRSIAGLWAVMSLSAGCAAGATNDDFGQSSEAGASDAGGQADGGGGGAGEADGSTPVLDANPSCIPKTCAGLGANCGAADNGCGQLIDCGVCPDGQSCGATKANVCGFICTPRTCAQLGASCGQQGDGCGGLIDCGPCSGTETCGGAGVLNACGEPGTCTPKTCLELGAHCGATADGCGGIIGCGSCDQPGEICGAVAPNVCGAGVSVCTPKSCADLGVDCGIAGDGCGGVTASCGVCTIAGQVCGGGGVPNVCGGSTGVCTPKTCAELGADCGYAGDGCGAVVDCGACGPGEICGLSQPNVCGAAATCTPKSCADLGATCGAVPDGCGGVIASCGTCAAPQSCSGDSNHPYQCGCTGVCSQVPTCAPGATTTLTGVVKDPAGSTPLPNVLVYIPNQPQDPALQTFPATLSCDQCGANAAGNPLVSTFTSTNGSFTLDGVPVGSDVVLVIQVGRWRRLFHVSIPNACQANTVSGTGQGGTTIQGGVLTMPKNKTQGNIPMTAIVTALGDNIECVFLKMGVSQSEFTNPGDGGRIEIYNAAGRGPYDIALGGAFIDYSTPDSADLVNKLASYDQVLLPCPGTASVTGDPLLTSYDKLVAYADAGGRLFTTHYSYIYLQRGGTANPFFGTAAWSTDHSQQLSATASVDTDPSVNPKGAAFADWLTAINALSTTSPPTMVLTEARHDVTSVVAPTRQWLHYYPGGQEAPLHFDFNAPVGALPSQQCGRVVFSDFHVVQSPSSATFFPDECSTAPMTAQEKVLEYMLFDLASCVQPYTSGCNPVSCAEQGIECGPATDGCGNVIQCGTCSAGTSCGGGGQPGKCGALSCTPKTCPQLGFECGATGDGCGNILACGDCAAPLSCGGGGVVGKCGSATCIPRTCLQLGLECGSAGDGCGNAIECGDCQAPETCGGAGVPGQCGLLSCTPRSCAEQGAECGQMGDGCGNVLACGDCVAPETCGGGGVPGKCGIVTCTPAPCGTRCGPQGDGCGGVIDCPACDGGAGCEPMTCASFGATCGKIGDGCGGIVDCGACPAGTTCGGGGVPYQCGGVH